MMRIIIEIDDTKLSSNSIDIQPSTLSNGDTTNSSEDQIIHTENAGASPSLNSESDNEPNENQTNTGILDAGIAPEPM